MTKIALTINEISGLHLKGGSILHTSRANPTRKAEHLENVVKSLDTLGVDHLITIGGDDTASSANLRLSTASVPRPSSYLNSFRISAICVSYAR